MPESIQTKVYNETAENYMRMFRFSKLYTQPCKHDAGSICYQAAMLC